MSVLPRVSGRDVVKALSKAGYQHDRQRSSHIILRQPAYPHRRIAVPDHKEVAKGTLRSIIREIGLTVDVVSKICYRLILESEYAIIRGDSLTMLPPTLKTKKEQKLGQGRGKYRSELSFHSPVQI